jgi:hypothetical protein
VYALLDRCVAAQNGVGQGATRTGRPLRGRIAASRAPDVRRQVRCVAHSLRCARAAAVAAIQKCITRSRAVGNKAFYLLTGVSLPGVRSLAARPAACTA